MNEYNYMCIVLKYNTKFNVAEQNIYEKENRAMFGLLTKIINFFSPVDVAMKRFTNLVKPLLLYSYEVWGGRTM